VRRAAARLSHGGWTTFEASASEINAGTMYVGALEERLGAVIQQLRSVHKMLWVLRDFHQLLWIGRHSQSPTGVLEMLIPVLDSGEVLMLGETRPAALEGVLIKFPEVERLFEIVRLEPPSESELAGVVDAWATTPH